MTDSEINAQHRVFPTRMYKPPRRIRTANRIRASASKPEEWGSGDGGGQTRDEGDFETMPAASLDMERKKIRRELAWHEATIMRCQLDLDKIDSVECARRVHEMQQQYNADQEERCERQTMELRRTLGRCLRDDCCYLEYSKDLGKFEGHCCERCWKYDRKKMLHGPKCEHIHHRTLRFVPASDR